MKQIFYILIVLFTTTSSIGQSNIREINQQLLKLGVDASKQNNMQLSIQLIKAWNNLDHEENKYNPYIVLPMNTWVQLFEKQYEQTNESNLKSKIGIAYASILIDLSNYEKALKILKVAYAERKNVTPFEYKILLSNLEKCYKSRNEITNAIEIRKELIENRLINNYWRIYKACELGDAAIEDFKLFEKKKYYAGNNTIIQPAYYNDLCRLYFFDNKIDSAVIYGELGLQNVEAALQDKSIQFLNKNEILTNWKALYTAFLGKCDMNKKDYLKAMPKLKYAIDHGKIDIESNTLSMIYLSLCYMHLNDFKKYNIYIDSVKIRLKSIDAEDVIRSYYSANHIYYSKIKKFDSAFKYLTLYNQYREKINKGIQQNQSILLLGQLEIQKRRSELNEKNINFLKIESENKYAKGQIWRLGIFIGIIITILLLLTYFLIQSIKNKEKLNLINDQLNENIEITNEQFSKNDFLLKELHHRVKNNLQLIYSLLNLQKRRLTDPETKTNLTAVQNRIHTMSLVHEFLYNSDNYEYINVNEYIITLTNHLKSIYKKEENVEIQYNIEEDIELETERMIYLGLIINEIVSNTFKFEIGNAVKSIINITIASIDGIIEMEISDNGPGFDKELIRHESLGLKLITIMCTQLNAIHEISSKDGVQHTIKFSFDKS
jgi:two-component sensor histidine kinase